MAASTDRDHHGIPAMDYAEHEKSFGVFANLVKWGAVGSLALTLLAGAATHTVPWSFALIVTILMVAVVSKFF